MRRIPDSETLYVLVGQHLARKRGEANLTQTQLANLCGLTRGSIANIERGNQRPTLHTLWSLAEALDVEVNSLLPSPEEFRMCQETAASYVVTGRVKKAAGVSKSQVLSFITSSREKISANVH